MAGEVSGRPYCFSKIAHLFIEAHSGIPLLDCVLNFIKKPGVLFMSSVPFRISLRQLVKAFTIDSVIKKFLIRNSAL